jgi:hypothetical protein
MSRGELLHVGEGAKLMSGTRSMLTEHPLEV